MNHCSKKIRLEKKIKGERKDVSPFLLKKKMISVHPQGGVANGKTRDSPRRRDPCLKIRDRDLKVLTKSEPETSSCENPNISFSFGSNNTNNNN